MNRTSKKKIVESLQPDTVTLEKEKQSNKNTVDPSPEPPAIEVRKSSGKALSENELNTLLLLLERSKKEALEARIFGKDAELTDMRAENIRYKINLLKQEAGSLRQKALAKEQQSHEIKVSYDNYVKTLAEKYDLPEHWAYEEHTGEIHIPPEETTK